MEILAKHKTLRDAALLAAFGAQTYGAVGVDEEIPIRYDKAVAEVIGYVMRLKSKLSASPARIR